MNELFEYLTEAKVPNANVALAIANNLYAESTEDALDDLTATAADITAGKTAIISTGKVIGTSNNINTSDANATGADLLSGKTAYSKGQKITGAIPSKSAQTYTPSTSIQTIKANQYLAGVQTIEAVPTEQKTITPSASNQTITPTTGKFLNSITVNGDANLVAGNIKSGISIFGVQGTLTSLDTSDADATAENIDSGKTAYVKGQKITGTSTKINTSDANAVASDIMSGKTAYVNGTKLTGTHTCPAGLDTNDATAAATDILSGKTAYVKGIKVTGSIPSIESAIITPGTLDQTINAGQYVAGAQTIKGEPNLLAENIKNGVSIFGVSGTYSGTPTTITAVHQGKVKDTSNITLQTGYRTTIMKNNFEFDDGYVLAEGDVIMFPDNVWVSAVVSVDVSICNHSSTDTYELKGKTCYVLSKAEAMT